MIAASYTRKNTKFGDVISVSEQNIQIEQFAKEHRIRITQRYSDKKSEPDSEDGFLEMKEAGLNRRFDCIVFWSIMCFGRDPLNGYNLLRHGFFPAGIDFAIVKDDFISVGKTADEIEEFLDQKYHERRKAHCVTALSNARGKRQNTLYGYSIEDGRFVIDENVRPIVSRIFSLALEGKNQKQILDILNLEKIEAPQIYLRRVAGRSTEGISTEWNLRSVKKILSDTRYKGKQKTTRNGELFFIQIPAYIDEDAYEKINVRPETTKQIARTENPLCKKVFDKETQINMYLRDYKKDGRHYYHVSRQNDVTRQYKTRAIPADTVISKVESAMRCERQIALNVLQMLGTEECEKELQRQVQPYDDELHKVFDRMLYVDKEMFLELDKRYSELYEIIMRIKAAYSIQNTWIKTYSDMSEDEKLSLQSAKKYVEKVLVYRNEAVEFVPKYDEMKRFFPQAWLRLEV